MSTLIYIEEKPSGRKRTRGLRWSALWTHSGFEYLLHEFAEKVGLRSDWFIDHPTTPHYWCSPFFRNKAIRMGAILKNKTDHDTTVLRH